MQFSIVVAFQLALCANALTTPFQQGSSKLARKSMQAEYLERRAIIAVLATAAGTAAVSAITKQAIDRGASLIENLLEFDDAREEFTKSTTFDMATNNPDPTRLFASICCNTGFTVEDPSLIDGQVTARLEVGVLNTDYECMYMGAPNTFTPQGDGGFINRAFNFDQSRCTLEDGTGVLRCT